MGLQNLFRQDHAYKGTTHLNLTVVVLLKDGNVAKMKDGSQNS